MPVRQLLTLLFLCAVSMIAEAAPARPEALVFHAVQPGRQALDAGDGGGNPFASALIEVLGRPSADLKTMAAEIERLTSLKSSRHMVADVPQVGTQGSWSLVPARAGERRVALVLVVSDYSRAGAQSLPGARHDAARVVAALSAAGFETESTLDLDAAAMRHRLETFARRSAEADAAIIYTTGHGVEVGNRVYLLPADFPVAHGREALQSRAVVLADIAGSLRARKINLVFFGGCRDDPFGN